MADTSIALAKRKRKQAWRTFHRRMRTINSLSQELYRYSQKINEQPSMISAAQVAKFADKISGFEREFSAAQRELGIVAQIIQTGF